VANFLPLKHHMFYCLDRFIEQYGLHGPFLEIGCGRGDVSAYLARKGWQGTAIDFSDTAVAQASVYLRSFPQIAVRKQSLGEVTGAFACIIMWDVLEHIEDDRDALRMVEHLLHPGGQLLLAVPSNPREWRWDDEFYGHFRRYTVADMTEKLTQAGIPPQVFWDFTFPMFWLMRRIYTRIKSGNSVAADKEASTKASATVNAWDMPFLSRLLDRTAVLWYPLHRLQFRLFRNATSRGHEFFVLARKSG
jgi:cyclopropane fatty-acyl-phospholipid synthase-like methyltransferase